MSLDPQQLRPLELLRCAAGYAMLTPGWPVASPGRVPRHGPLENLPRLVAPAARGAEV